VRRDAVGVDSPMIGLIAPGIGVRMDSQPLSVPDLAEQLMREFESVLPISTVTETVMRISRNGADALTVLADLARQELVSIVAALETPTAASSTAD
jgi:hypothetical protein